jgi:hypothetical protein
MILIAHRGNTNGPISDKENSPQYLIEALSKGYYVEVDVWKIDEQVFLGHDKPEYLIDISFLKSDVKFICHAKTPETLELLLKHNIHCFFHDTDECVLTSKGFIWTYPGKKLTNMSICVMPEWQNPKLDKDFVLKCYGVCSDWISKL